MSADGGAIVSAVETYLRRWRSVGLFRLVDDLLKGPDLLPAFAMIGAVEIQNGNVVPPRLGTPEWWLAYNAVRDAVLQLETRGLVEYVSEFDVVNWRGDNDVRGAGGPGLRAPPPPGPPQGASARAPGNARNKSVASRKKATLDMWM